MCIVPSISKSIRKAYGKEIDRNRVTKIQEISGHGILAKVDGQESQQETVN